MGVYENLVFSKNIMTGHSLDALTFIVDLIRFLSDPLRGHIDISLSIFCNGWELGELYCQQENFIFVLVNSVWRRLYTGNIAVCFYWLGSHCRT